MNDFIRIFMYVDDEFLPCAPWVAMYAADFDIGGRAVGVYEYYNKNYYLCDFVMLNEDITDGSQIINALKEYFINV